MVSKACRRAALSGFVVLLLLGVVTLVQRTNLGPLTSVGAVTERSGRGRVLLAERGAAAPEERQEPLVGRGVGRAAALSPLSSSRSEQTSLSAERRGTTPVSKASASEPASAPSPDNLDTTTKAPAPAPAGLLSSLASGVKRYASLIAEGPSASDEEGSGGEVVEEEDDTEWDKSLSTSRKGDTSVKETKPGPGNEALNTTKAGGSDLTSDEGDASHSEGQGDGFDDDEESLITSENNPPKLEHHTSSWEGFGDPSKKLTLVVVCSNSGGGVLEVKIVTPTWIRADPESVRVGAGEERNITITVLDPKGLKGASEKIQIKSNGGDEFFEITRAALGQTNWTDTLPSSGFSAVAMFAVGATVVGLAGLTWCICRRRRQRHGASSFKYKELEMQGDLSSALGQLPAGAGMAMSYSSGYGPDRSARTPTEEESSRGWDDNWDDWDQEEQRSRR